MFIYFLSVSKCIENNGQLLLPKKVRDLVNQIRNDESDIDDFESSGDEFKLRKCDLDELSSYSSNWDDSDSDSDDSETLYQLKKTLKTQKFTSVLDSDSESENIPLAAYINEKKQNRDHRDLSLRKLSLQDITEDADLLDALPQLQNQQWNWSNQQYKEPCSGFTENLRKFLLIDGSRLHSSFSNSWLLTI